MIERSEKQVILARHARRLLNLLDDTPVVPGDARPAFEHANQARQILLDAEEDLRDWQPDYEPITSDGATEANLLPSTTVAVHAGATAGMGGRQTTPQQQQSAVSGGTQHDDIATSDVHPAYRKGEVSEVGGQESIRSVSGGSTAAGGAGGGNARNDSLYSASHVGGAGTEREQQQQQYAAM